MAEIAEGIVTNLQDTFPGRQVEVNIEKRMAVSGDSRMHYSVLENLLNNAWKYSANTEHAKIYFYEECKTNHAGERERVFVIKDNGVGFDMQHAGKLCVTFQRLHSKRECEGTGVGLSTVERIIEKHGGKIWAEAEVNKGVTFFFTLPDE